MQVVRDGAQYLHALGHVGGDAGLHGVERGRGVRHFGRAVFLQQGALGVRVQCFGRVGQARQRPHGKPHGQPRATDQQHQLHRQHHQQPRRGPHRRQMDIQHHGLPVGQHDARLDVPGVVCHGAYGQRARAAQCGFDGAGSGARDVQPQGLIGLAVPQQVLAVAAGQARQPGRAFIGGQSVQHVHGDGDVAFQVAQHHVPGGVVAFVEQRGKRQAVRQHQSDQKNQE
ncbi:hypothetical protein D3C73_1106550 [compost metagenome]